MKKKTKVRLLALFAIIFTLTLAITGLIVPSALDENTNVYATTSVTKMYATPDEKTISTGILDTYSVVNVTAITSGWCAIDLNGTPAFIKADNVKLLPASQVPAQDANRQFAIRLFNKVNEHRISIGVQPLTWDETIYLVAQTRATEIYTLWSHTRPNGQAPSSAFYEQGIKYKHAGENLLRYSTDEYNSLNAWLSSPTHKAALESANFNKSAIFVYKGADGKYYIAQEFTN